jgi:hypothetical protein
MSKTRIFSSSPKPVPTHQPTSQTEPLQLPAYPTNLPTCPDNAPTPSQHNLLIYQTPKPHYVNLRNQHPPHPLNFTPPAHPQATTKPQNQAQTKRKNNLIPKTPVLNPHNHHPSNPHLRTPKHHAENMLIQQEQTKVHRSKVKAKALITQGGPLGKR